MNFNKNSPNIQTQKRQTKFKNLPHIDILGEYQFITFRTEDSVDDFVKKISHEEIKNAKK